MNSRDVQVSYIYHIKKQFGKILDPTGEIWQRKLFFPIGLTHRGCSLETLRRGGVFPLKSVESKAPTVVPGLRRVPAQVSISSLIRGSKLRAKIGHLI